MADNCDGTQSLDGIAVGTNPDGSLIVVPPTFVDGVGNVANIICDDPDPTAPVEPAFEDSRDCKCATMRLCPFDDEGELVEWWELCDQDGTCKWRPKLDVLFQQMTEEQAAVVCSWLDENCDITAGVCTQCVTSNLTQPDSFTGTSSNGDQIVMGSFTFDVGGDCPQNIDIGGYFVLEDDVTPPGNMNVQMCYSVDSGPLVPISRRVKSYGIVPEHIAPVAGCIPDVAPGAHSIEFVAKLINQANTQPTDEVRPNSLRPNLSWAESCDC